MNSEELLLELLEFRCPLELLLEEVEFLYDEFLVL